MQMQVQAAMVLQAAHDWLAREFGADQADMIDFISWKNHIIKMRSSNSALLTQVKMRESDLLTAVNDKFGKGAATGCQYLGS